MNARADGTGDGAPSAGTRVAPLEWLALVVGIALVVRYAWQLDDAFVYFRYADNWALLGRGPVFNEGEWVEGYTSPLWLLILTGLRAWTPLPYWTITRVAGVLAFALFWWLLVRVRRAAAPPGSRVVNLPLALCAGLYPVATYFTSGTESPLVLVGAAACALFAFDPRSRFAAVCVGALPLVRPELAVASVVLIVWRWTRERGVPKLGLASLVASNGAWLVFRIWAYASLVPNTFHAKDGTHWAWGVAYLHDTLLPYGGYVLLVLLPFAWWYGGRGESSFDPVRGARWPLVLSAGLIALFVTRIGGDGRHFRYLAFPAVLSLCAASGLVPRAFGRRLAPGSAIGLGVVFVVASGTLYPRQLDRHPLLPGALEQRVGVVRDAQYHRALSELSGPRLGSGAPTEVLSSDELHRIWRGARPAVPTQAALRTVLAELREDPPPPVWEVNGWCFTCWRNPATSFVHPDGLTDAILARTEAEPWRPGHYRTLLPAAEEVARVRAQFGTRRGAFSDHGALVGPEGTVLRGAEAVAAIERRVFNDHDFLENLVLALERTPRVRLARPR